MGRKTRLVQPSTKPPKQPVVRIAAHPLAWATALQIAGDDSYRLRVLPDGSVLVTNQPRKRRQAS